MRRPNWSHIFTNGFTAIRKSIALVTKGIIDQKLGGKEKVKVILFIEKLFKIKGIKSFEVELIYEIRGNKLYTFESTLILVGKIMIPLEKECLIKALLQRQSINIIKLLGKKEFETSYYLNLNGRKRFNLIENLNINAIKRFYFALNKPLIARKLFNIVENRKLNGCKEIDIDNQLLVKGKRDINNILTALDMEI